MSDIQCCGTCFWHLPTEDREWICNNAECDGYGCGTSFDDGKDCMEYKERD